MVDRAGRGDRCDRACAARAGSRESARAEVAARPRGRARADVVAVLMVPFGTDTRSIETHVTDAGYVGALPTEEQRL